MLFLDYLHAHCNRLAHKTAIEFVAPDSAETHMVTYRQLEEAIQRTMTLLHRMVSKQVIGRFATAEMFAVSTCTWRSCVGAISFAAQPRLSTT